MGVVAAVGGIGRERTEEEELGAPGAASAPSAPASGIAPVVSEPPLPEVGARVGGWGASALGNCGAAEEASSHGVRSREYVQGGERRAHR